MSEKIIAAVIILGIILVIAHPFIVWSTEESVDITIKEKWIKSYDATSQKYLIASTDGEVFENTDEIFYLKFNSSDVYAQIDVGKTYEAKVIRWRIPFFGWYRNIIEVKEVKAT